MTSTADWIVAVSSAAGAVGTVGSLGFLAWSWASDRRKDRRQEHRDQASKVNCWLEDESIHDTGELPSELQRTVAAELHWQNRSGAPISQLEVLFSLAPVLIGGQPNPFADTLLPEQGQDPRWTHVASTVAPNAESSKRVEYTFRGFGAASPPEGTEPMLVWWFTDAAGVGWIKNSRGRFDEDQPGPGQAGAIWAEVFGAAFNRGSPPSESGPG
jgi:hypothetical protein